MMKPCERCGVMYTCKTIKSMYCEECIKQKNRENALADYRKNREKRMEYNRLYYLKNKERKKTNNKNYYSKNKEKWRKKNE